MSAACAMADIAAAARPSTTPRASARVNRLTVVSFVRWSRGSGLPAADALAGGGTVSSDGNTNTTAALQFDVTACGKARPAGGRKKKRSRPGGRPRARWKKASEDQKVM